ncbi:MAG TPA: hypothetical protein PKN33_16540 [Phycisphaerae bacterium]|nr:hypothetical protein [Phycisphaerae bacterium]
MAKRFRKRRIAIIAFVFIIAALIGFIVVGGRLRERVYFAGREANEALDMQSSSFRFGSLKKGQKRTYIMGSSSSMGESGAQCIATLHVEDATNENFEEWRNNSISRDGGQVGYVVNLSFDPVIEIYHSDIPEAGEVAQKMQALLAMHHNVKIVSTSMTNQAIPNATAAPDAKWVALIAGYGPPGVAASILCIIFIFVWSLAETLTMRKLNASGHHCRKCGYDLRGTPGIRCSECGEVLLGH